MQFFKSHTSKLHKKRTDTKRYRSIFMGWMMGLEPTIFRATI